MSHAPEVHEAQCLLVFCGSRPAAHVTRASREAAERLASENVILRRRGALAFSHGQDPRETSAHPSCRDAANLKLPLAPRLARDRVAALRLKAPDGSRGWGLVFSPAPMPLEQIWPQGVCCD